MGRKQNKPHLTNFNLDEFIHSIYQSPDHIIISDAQGIVIYVNKAAERVTGFSVGEILGTKAGKLWGGLMEEDYYKKMWSTIMIDKQDFIGLINNKRKDGVCYSALIRIIPITDDHDLVRYFIGIEKPVTGDSSDSEMPALQSINLGKRKASDIEKMMSSIS